MTWRTWARNPFNPARRLIGRSPARLGRALELEAREVPTVSLSTLGDSYTQNFDTLPATGSATWIDDSTIPGWFHARTGTGSAIVADDGSGTAGNLYSYGTGTDRALGSVGTGDAATGNIFWGVRVRNDTGATITSLDIRYTGEQWRNSGGSAQTLAFSYLVGSPTVTGSLAEFQSAGVAVPQLAFNSPVTGGSAGPLDGNQTGNRRTRTFTIDGLDLPDGAEVMFRWSDPDHTGPDHGLAIDDFSVTPHTTPIHDIQGNGASSPIVGKTVITRGIVTGVKSDGFFIQAPDADADADPATSEGIFVSTGSAPPASMAVGNEVAMTGTVTEFMPTADPLQPPTTRITAPAVTLISTGHPLPSAVPLTDSFPSPAGAFDQLQRVEGMRVSVGSLTVTAPTQGTLDGVFFGVVTGVAGPVGGPGSSQDNPELLRIDSDGLNGASPLSVGTGAVVTGLVGPLDYSSRFYTILPDPGAPIAINEAPTDLALSNTSVAENRPTGTVVGALGTIDADASDTFAYTLVSGAGDDDNAFFTIDEAGNLRTAASFNFESKLSYTIRVRSTDLGGLFSEKSFTVSVTDVNELPTITVDQSNVTVNEGSAATNGGTFDDPDGRGTVTLSASLGTVTQDTVAGTWTWSHTPSGSPGEPTDVIITASDASSQSTATFTMSVTSAGPTAAIGGPASGVRGQPRNFSFRAGAASIADQVAGFVYTINWGDGSPIQTIARTAGNGSGVTLEHTFRASGKYMVTVTATDKDNATSPVASHVIRVVAVEMQGDDLVVGGTNGNESIALTTTPKGEVKARVGGSLMGSFSPTGKIVVYGQGGDDKIRVANRVALPAWLDGGDGNDTLRGTNKPDVLKGGGGNDVILAGAGIDDIEGGDGNDVLRGGADADVLTGGDGNDKIHADSGGDWVDAGAGDDSITGGYGNDTLFAGAGSDRVNGGYGRDLLLGGDGDDALVGSSDRDLLIGGQGGDSLLGNGDLLIAGTTAFDSNLSALDAILSEWSSGRSYTTRLANLTGNGSESRANGSFFLTVSGLDATAFDDGSVDVLKGTAGSDWYFANVSGGVSDQLGGRSGNEIVEELEIVAP